MIDKKMIIELKAVPKHSGNKQFKISLSKTYGVEPYVTHLYDEKNDKFYNGHYFRVLEDALKDFRARTH